MLIRFTVENFKSICQSQTLSMIANNRFRTHKDHLINMKKNVNVLKACAVYGANASGKSNLVEAFRFAKFLVTEKIFTGSRNFFCRTGKNNEEKPSRFDFEFSIKGNFYAYGFTVLLNESRFITEYLYKLDPIKNLQTYIFERDIESKYFESNEKFFSEKDNKRLEIYKSDFSSDSSVLFLNEVNRNKKFNADSKLSVFKDVYSWFKINLHTINPYSKPGQTPFFIIKNKEEVEEIIKIFDTGIYGIRLEKLSHDDFLKRIPRFSPNDAKEFFEELKKDVKNILKEQLSDMTIVSLGNSGFYKFEVDEKNHINIVEFKFLHNNSNYPFSINQESDGTKRLIDLLFILLLDSSEQTFVIDELERSLHPNLVRIFLDLFLSQKKELNNQLIFTSHEATLLNQKLLRRDEIWFMEKSTEGVSSIYSLKEFETRYDKSISKAYLAGRYGAVPYFQSLPNERTTNGII